ncbi:sigma-70 family RNA polymerase sigma factor [Paraburkholderia strydomiana]|uniref:sigma-70 family RNA polymerase sigma factor n=1 Tax=Paraburkholderia strydomiana TaxID=1245417 RepID=UPI001BE85C1E|nr:sigma-70 family RNA polymerase sigma factor [Paraburkholderia strydomiana]MBT2790048.1 sigma-70 family RNA polymerase sigma factor [Paraburkholderia strydomiana]
MHTKDSVDSPAREEQWAIWMRAALANDADAYRRFLEDVTPYLRSMARRRCEPRSAPGSEVEDVVQEMLLAVHLKRGSWDQTRPIGPWLSTIARNKMVDILRQRVRHESVPIEDVAATLASKNPRDAPEHGDLERLLKRLGEPQRSIVQSLSLDGHSVRDTATRLNMTEGAISVALHRAVKKLASMYRNNF